MVMASTSVPMNTQAAEEAAWGIVKGRSTRSVKFTDETPAGSKNYVDRPIGTTYTGVLVENVVASQATDFDTKQPKTYKDGTPILELILVLSIPSDIDPEDAEDDGNRVLRLGATGKRALQDECRRLGIERFGVGTQVTITFTGYKPNGQGRPSKTFDIKLDNVQPWRSAEQMQVEQAMQQGVQPQIATVAQPVPTVAQPIAVPQQPVAVPQQPIAVPQQPVAAPAVDPALLAMAQAAQAGAAAAAPAAGLVITNDHVEKVRALIAMNIAREIALQAVTNTDGGGNEAFMAALDAAEQNAPF